MGLHHKQSKQNKTKKIPDGKAANEWGSGTNPAHLQKKKKRGRKSQQLKVEEHQSPRGEVTGEASARRKKAEGGATTSDWTATRNGRAPNAFGRSDGDSETHPDPVAAPPRSLEGAWRWAWRPRVTQQRGRGLPAGPAGARAHWAVAVRDAGCLDVCAPLCCHCGGLRLRGAQRAVLLFIFSLFFFPTCERLFNFFLAHFFPFF